MKNPSSKPFFGTGRSILLLLFLLLSLYGTAQSQYPLIFDKKLSQHFGAYNSIFVQRGVYSFQDKYIPDTLFGRKNLFRKGLNVGFRFAKLFLLDMQEDYIIALAQHEAYGHGARYREYGARSNSVHLSLPFPFGDGSGHFLAGNVVTGFTPHENIAGSIGGVEANQVLANSLACNFLQSDSIHYRQALLYLMAQNNQLFYIWSDKAKGLNSGGDMSGYVLKLNWMYGPVQTPYSLEKLSVQSLVSLANPLQLYCAFTLVYKYGLQGKKFLPKIPMLRFGEVRYLPYFNYTLTPFGGEYQFCNVLKYKTRLLMADFGIGEGTFNDLFSVRLKLYNVIHNRFVSINVHADLWNQPELKLSSGPFVVQTKNQTRGAAKVDFMFHPSRTLNRFSLFAQVGYKSRGFVVGEELAETFILRYGICLDLP